MGRRTQELEPRVTLKPQSEVKRRGDFEGI